MSIKDKVIFGLMLLLLIGGGYIQYTYSLVIDRMNVIEAGQNKHVKDVNKDFREDLRVLDLQFIGRGKHLQKAQKDIVANTKLIYATEDTLTEKIEYVAYDLEEFEREVNREMKTVNTQLSDIQDVADSQRRRVNRKFSDLEQELASVKNDLKKLTDKVNLEHAEEPKKGKK